MQNLICDLYADQLEKIPGGIRADEKDLGRVGVRFDLCAEHRHVDRVRDILDAAPMLQR